MKLPLSTFCFKGDSQGDAMNVVLDAMPPFPERESALMKRIKSKLSGTADAASSSMAEKVLRAFAPLVLPVSLTCLVGGSDRCCCN